jgi:uncharacterized lipoprotein
MKFRLDQATRISVLFILGFFVSGCATIKITPTYSPQSTEEIDGRVYVNDFSYFPKEGVQQNEIRETAIGTVLITDPVGRFIADAVRREFRQSGISLKEEEAICYLDGEVNDFAIDSLGFSSNYITDIRYILKYREDDRILYDNNFNVNFNTSKFVDASIILANLNKAVADNIEQLLIDDEFRDALETQCPM